MVASARETAVTTSNISCQALTFCGAGNALTLTPTSGLQRHYNPGATAFYNWNFGNYTPLLSLDFTVISTQLCRRFHDECRLAAHICSLAIVVVYAISFCQAA